MLAEIFSLQEPRLVIISSGIVTILIFFYIFTIGSYFNLEIFILKNRITYDTHFSNIYLINERTDHILISILAAIGLCIISRNGLAFLTGLIFSSLTAISIFLNIPMITTGIALTSMPVLAGVILYQKYMKKNGAINFDVNVLMNYFAIGYLGLGVYGLLSVIVLMFNPSAGSQPNYTYYIFTMFSRASPVLMALLIFCVPVKFLGRQVINVLSEFFHKPTILDLAKHNLSQVVPKRRSIAFYLTISVFVSVILAATPHLPLINQEDQQIGADSDIYVKWEQMIMNSTNGKQLLEKVLIASGGDRPISLLFFHFIVKLFGGDILDVIDNLPVLLSPMLVLSVFFLTRQLTSNHLISLLASFLTAVSFQIPIGLYAGFYANWFALSIGYTALAFLIRYLNNPTRRTLAIYSSFLILLLFSHVYTWSVLTIIIGIFLGVVAKANQPKRKAVLVLFLVLIGTVVVDLTRMIVAGTQTGLARDISIAKTEQTGLAQFSERWDNLTQTIWSYYGGLFGNFIILGLCMYWVLTSESRTTSTVLILTFLSIGILPLFFTGWVIQSRVWYDIPFQIPVAIILGATKRSARGFVFVLATCLWLLTVALRATTNLTLG